MSEQRSGSAQDESRDERNGEPRDEKKKKRSLTRGVRERASTMYGLGRTLVEEPRSFPSRLKDEFLKWVRAVWNARGGGFYACGFVVTFVFLEVKLLVTELIADSAAGFVVQQLLQLLFRFTVDSLVNTALALVWPALVLQLAPEWGLVGLIAGYFIFRRFLKEPLTRFLFGEPG